MTDLRCPRCQAPPPALATCDACEEGYAPLVTAGACPRCALVWDRLECAACEGWTRLELWIADDGERRAFLERLLGPRGVDWEQVLTTTSRALGADVSSLFSREAEPTEEEERATARAEVLEAEDALAQARRGEAELAALAPEATSSALGPELEAARRASKAAVDAALRALDEARQRAEALNRRALDATRADPVEPPPPAEVTANGPHAARCPACGWQPDGYPRWTCSRAGCETRFDAFATGARCPACARSFATTTCCACRQVAAPEAWWRAGGGTPPSPRQPISEPPSPKEPAVAGWLASKMASLLDRGDATQDHVAASLEHAAGATDRTLGRVMSFAASLADDGVAGARLEAGDWSGAVEECTRALRRDPTHAVALAHRGLAYVQLGRDASARADLDAALQSAQLTPAQRASALRARASLRYELWDFAGVVTDATQAIALQPERGTSYAQRSAARWHLRQVDDALADAHEAVRRSTAPVSRLLWRAVLHEERDAWSELEADASAALEQGAGPSSLLYRAHARLRLGQVDAALDDASRALRLDPGDADALFLRATARRDPAGASADLRRLRRRDPWGRRTSRWFALAIEAHLAGEPDRVRHILRDARDHHDRPEYGLLWLWALLDHDGPWPAAHADWPGALIRFARGELDLDALLPLAATTTRAPGREADRRAEAYCLAGLRAERAGEAADAERMYRACVDAGVRWGVAHLWATLRLAGVTPRPPRPSAPAPKIPCASPAPPPGRARSAPAPTLADQLERLARLREQGVLDDDEFALAKRRLLGL